MSGFFEEEHEKRAELEPVSVPGLRLVAARPPVEGLLFPLNGTEPRAAEQYRIIRTKVLMAPRAIRMLCVSSPQVGDGKSITAVNLAGALALKLGQSVLLVDGDFRRSSLGALLGVPSSPGLAEVLAGNCGWKDAVARLENPPNLYFLPAGQNTAHPAELFDSPAWSATCFELRRHFHCIVVDCPPVGLVADYYLIEAAADAVIVVVRPDHTLRSLCFKALDTVPPEKLLGVIINMAPAWFLSKPAAHGYPYYAERAGKRRGQEEGAS
jgi:capsular exopolysaccharide synthesis family protein